MVPLPDSDAQKTQGVNSPPRSPLWGSLTLGRAPGRPESHPGRLAPPEWAPGLRVRNRAPRVPSMGVTQGHSDGCRASKRRPRRQVCRPRGSHRRGGVCTPGRIHTPGPGKAAPRPPSPPLAHLYSDHEWGFTLPSPHLHPHCPPPTLLGTSAHPLLRPLPCSQSQPRASLPCPLGPRAPQEQNPRAALFPLP